MEPGDAPVAKLKRPFRSPAVFAPVGNAPLKRARLTDANAAISSADNCSPVVHNAGESIIYNCLWRKQQLKKHGTWDGDGRLIVSKGRYTLQDLETGKQLGSSSFSGIFDPNNIDIIKIGSLEVQVETSNERQPFQPSKQEVEHTKHLPKLPNPRNSNILSSNSLSKPTNSDVKVIDDAPREPMRKRDCLWRKRMNKAGTWEGDGILEFKGSEIVLYDKYTQKSLTSGQTVNIDGEKPARLGGYEVMVPENDVAAVIDSKATSSSSSKPSLKPSFKGLVAHTGAAVKGKVLKRRIPEDAIALPTPSKECFLKEYRDHVPELSTMYIDPLLARRLRSHQISGVIFLYKCMMGIAREGTGAILADEMGLGKTAQIITLIWTLLKQTPRGINEGVIQRALVVCPVSLVKNWVKEFSKWLGKSRIRIFAADGDSDIRTFGLSPANSVLIIGYERLRTVVKDLNAAQPPFGLLICDEGHRLKSAGGKTLAALQSMNIKRRIILTGTPIQNDMSEFYTMAHFVLPDCFDTYGHFKQHFETPILKSREVNCPAKKVILGKSRAEQLGQITRTFVIRRTNDVISSHLPPKFEYVLFCVPTELQLQLYKAVLESKETRDVCSDSVDGRLHLMLLTALTKICNSPGILIRDSNEGKSLPTGLSELLSASLNPSLLNVSGKILVLTRILSHIKKKTNEKVVLVSNFTRTLDIFEALCLKRSYGYCRLDGSTAPGKRMETGDRFNKVSQNEQFVFLLSSKAGGTGLNIVGASRLILFDLDWNPANDLQAMARIYRDGQTRPTRIYRLLTLATIDEKIFQRQVMKTGLSGSLIDNDATQKHRDTFTLEDLRDLFTLCTNTISNTHDLAGCTKSECNGSSVIYSDEPPTPSFISAKAIPDDASQRKSHRERLSQLRDWHAVHCDDDAEVDKVTDDVLKEVLRSPMNRRDSAEPTDGVRKFPEGCIPFVYQKVPGGSDEIKAI